MYFFSFFIIAVVQFLCVIVCRASVNKDVYFNSWLFDSLLFDIMGVYRHISQIFDYWLNLTAAIPLIVVW